MECVCVCVCVFLYQQAYIRNSTPTIMGWSGLILAQPLYSYTTYCREKSLSVRLSISAHSRYSCPSLAFDSFLQFCHQMVKSPRFHKTCWIFIVCDCEHRMTVTADALKFHTNRAVHLSPPIQRLLFLWRWVIFYIALEWQHEQSCEKTWADLFFWFFFHTEISTDQAYFKIILFSFWKIAS